MKKALQTPSKSVPMSNIQHQSRLSAVSSQQSKLTKVFYFLVIMWVGIQTSYGQIVIWGSETWDNSNPPTAGYENGIDVRLGTLTIDNYTAGLFMNSNGYIKVRSGAHLVIDGTTITSANSASDVLWEGIEVKGDFIPQINSFRYFKNQFTTFPSKVLNNQPAWEGVLNPDNSSCLINNSTISFAKIGVYSIYGGTIRARGTNFENNEIGSKIFDYYNNSQPNVNACYFMNCNFKWTRSVSTINNSQKYGIYLSEVEGVNVGGCTFENIDITKYCMNQRGVGIYSIKSTLTVSSSGNTFCEGLGDLSGCLTNCENGSKGAGSTFTGLSKGIHFISTSFFDQTDQFSPRMYTYNLGVKFASFTNNIYGIHVECAPSIYIPGTCQFQNNFFTSDRTTLDDLFNVAVNLACYINTSTIFGIYIKKTPHDIYKNSLSFDGSNVQHVTIDESFGFGKGRIVNNTFAGTDPMTIATNNHFGIRCIGINNSEEIYCNNFANMGTDIKIDPGATVKNPIQGKGGNKANNLFSALLPGRDRVDNSGNPIGNLNYRIKNIPPEPSHNPNPNSLNVTEIFYTGEVIPSCDLTCSELLLKNKFVNFKALEISVYPVPSKDVVNIESKENNITKIVVFNAFGQIINTFENINENSFKFNLNGLISGIYYMAVSTNDGGLIYKTIMVAK